MYRPVRAFDEDRYGGLTRLHENVTQKLGCTGVHTYEEDGRVV